MFIPKCFLIIYTKTFCLQDLAYRYIFVFYTNLCSKLFLSKSKSPLFSLQILIFDLSQSTERSTGPMTGWPVDRPSRPWLWLCTYLCARCIGRPTGRPTVSNLLSVRLGRPGGRPLACNGQKFDRAVDRPVDRQIRWTVNGYFLGCFKFCLFVFKIWFRDIFWI